MVSCLCEMIGQAVAAGRKAELTPAVKERSQGACRSSRLQSHHWCIVRLSPLVLYIVHIQELSAVSACELSMSRTGKADKSRTKDATAFLKKYRTLEAVGLLIAATFQVAVGWRV